MFNQLLKMSESHRSRYWVLLALTLSLYVLLQPQFWVSKGAIYGDGGLFIAVLDQMKGLVVPKQVVWNHETLPFGYPPLAFIIVKGISLATGAATVLVTRIWVTVCLAATFVAFSWGLVAFKRSIWLTVCLATLPVIAVSLYTFPSMIGGLTRAPSFLCLAVGFCLWSHGVNLDRPKLVTAGFFATTSAALFHLESAVMSVLLLSIYAIAYRRAFWSNLLVAAIPLAAFGLYLLSRGQVGDVIAAATNVPPSKGLFFYRLTRFQFASEVTYPVVGVVLSAGMLFLAANRAYTLAVIPLVVLLALSRSSVYFIPFFVPAALMAIPLSQKWIQQRKAVLVALSFAIVVGIVHSKKVCAYLARGENYVISDADRKVMRIVSTDFGGERFLLFSGRYSDQGQVLEWAPYLSNGISLFTPQGREWKRGGWKETIDQQKAVIDAETPQEFMAKVEALQSRVLIFRRQDKEMPRQLDWVKNDPRFRVTFDSPGHVVLVDRKVPSDRFSTNRSAPTFAKLR